MNYRDRLKQKAVGSPTYEAVSQPLYTRAIGRWKHYENILSLVCRFSSRRLMPWAIEFGRIFSLALTAFHNARLRAGSSSPWPDR